MKNVAATNGQRVSLASFFLEEKACAGNLVVTGTLLNFCGVLLGRPPLSYERFRSKLATAEYRVHRAVQEKSARALKKSFSQSRAPDAAGRGVYCGANQNARRRKRNAPIYSAESDRSCRCVVHGGRRAGAARKLCSRHGDGCARAEGHGLHRSPRGSGPGEGCRNGGHPAPGKYSIFLAEGPAREPGGREEHEPVLSRQTRRHTDRASIVVDYEASGGALRLLD